jgi:AcrR family transcriptional regulator
MAYHHGNLRRALLDEALVTIRAEGVSALTLREIGARLGVSRTALYRHFADKRALLTAVATEGFRMLRERLVAAWNEGGHRPEAFHAMGVVYVRFAVSNPSHYSVMFGGFVEPGECDAELAVEAAGAFQALVDAVAVLQREGEVRGDDTVLMAKFVWRRSPSASVPPCQTADESLKIRRRLARNRHDFARARVPEFQSGRMQRYPADAPLLGLFGMVFAVADHRVP